MAMSEQEALEQLEACLQSARFGNFLSAQHDIDSIVAAFSDRVNVLHKAGVIKQMLGRYDDALDLLHRALKVLPNFHYSEMELANTYRLMGRSHDALAWFEKAISSQPDYILAYLRAATLRRELGDARGSADILARAQAIEPANQEVAGELAVALIYLNRRADAVEALAPIVSRPGAAEEHITRFMVLLTETGNYRRLLEFLPSLPASGSEHFRFHTDLLAGHARFALAANRSAVLAAATAREASPSWLSTPDVLDSLRAAVAARRPYSLIRLGDGEGRFLAYMDPATRRSLSEHDARTMVHSIWHNWFGEALATANPYDIARLNAATIRSIECADIIGLPAAARLTKDNLHFGYLAYLDGLIANIVQANPQCHLTDAFVSIQLHQLSPFLHDILTDAPFLGVIGPHDGLASRLASHHRIAATKTYLVPGERRLPTHLLSGTGRHFPDRYMAILRELTIPQPGSIFLVAAGLLGKVYCNRVRELGGIAIDIGSVADAWMGYDTRPGQFGGKQADWIIPNS